LERLPARARGPLSRSAVTVGQQAEGAGAADLGLEGVALDGEGAGLAADGGAARKSMWEVDPQTVGPRAQGDHLIALDEAVLLEDTHGRGAGASSSATPAHSIRNANGAALPSMAGTSGPLSSTMALSISRP